MTGGRAGAPGESPPHAISVAQAIASERTRDLETFMGADQLYQANRALQCLERAARRSTEHRTQNCYRDLVTATLPRCHRYAAVTSGRMQRLAHHTQREALRLTLIDELIAAAADRTGQRTATGR